MLYKYLNWNERTIENIKNSQLYFNIPKNFNDPFDIYPRFGMDSKSRKEMLDRFKKESQYPNKKAIQFADQFSSSELSNIIKNVAMPKFNSSGVLCLSQDNANILMWSHYANHHKGVCLEFDIDESDEHLDKFLDKEKNKKILSPLAVYLMLPAKYVQNDERPLYDVIKIINGDTSPISDALCTKSKLWKYEQEVRIVCWDIQNQQVFPSPLYYKPTCLKRVIFGANVTFNEFAERQQMISKISKDISFSIATLKKDSYGLNIVPINSVALQAVKENYDTLTSPNWILEE